jgi:hypothetical protein
VTIAIDDLAVVEALPKDAAGEDIPVVARRWAEALKKALDSDEKQQSRVRKGGF